MALGNKRFNMVLRVVIGFMIIGGFAGIWGLGETAESPRIESNTEVAEKTETNRMVRVGDPVPADRLGFVDTVDGRLYIEMVPAGVTRIIYHGNKWYAFWWKGKCYVKSDKTNHSSMAMAHDELCISRSD